MDTSMVSVRKWNADNLREDVKYLIERLKLYDAVVHDDGVFTVFVRDGVTKRIGRNHLKCMLRRDYLNERTRYRGKALDKFLNEFMDRIGEVAKKVIADEDREQNYCLVDIESDVV